MKQILPLLFLAGCSDGSADSRAEANEMRVMGNMPSDTKLAAADVLRTCGLPVPNARVFDNWEGSREEGRWIILVDPVAAASEVTAKCLDQKIAELRTQYQLGWRVAEEEPPRPEAPDA